MSEPANLPAYRPVYRSLHRPLTLYGVDRRLFFLALLVRAAMVSLFYSLLAACLMFGVLYGLALWSGSHIRRCCRSCSAPAAASREATGRHAVTVRGRTV